MDDCFETTNDADFDVLGDLIKLIGSSKRSDITGMDLFGILHKNTMLIIGSIFVNIGNIMLVIDFVNSNINKHVIKKFENI